jgi:uncharacterized protein YbjT (DUF2867 family)
MFVVAGVTGHVGGVAAGLLLDKKQKVKVIVRDAAKGAPWAQRGAEIAVGVIDDQAFLTATLKGAEGFFTLLPPDMRPPDMYTHQVKSSDAIAGAVKASGVRHVVLLSSVGADLPSGTGPIKGLHYLEEKLRGTGVVLSAIRAGYFQENVGQVLGAARAQGIYPNFGAPHDAPMPMIATKDIGALAAELLMQKPGKSEVVDLHGPAYTVNQVVEKLGAALGKKLQIVDIPEPGWIPAMTQAGMPEHVAEVYAEMYRGFGSGSIKPKGDRMVQGKATLDDTIKKLVG